MDNLDEGQNLGKLLGSVNRRNFARDYKVPGGGSMISQHVSGHRPIGLEAGIAYAKGLGVTLDQISPRLAAQVNEAAGLTGRAAITANTERGDSAPYRQVGTMSEIAGPMLTVTFSAAGVPHFSEAVKFVGGRPAGSWGNENIDGLTRYVITFYRTPRDADQALQLLAYLGQNNDAVFIHAGGRLVSSAAETLRCYAGASASGDIEGFCDTRFHDQLLPCSRLIQAPRASESFANDDVGFMRRIHAAAVRAECEWCPLFDSKRGHVTA